MAPAEDEEKTEQRETKSEEYKERIRKAIEQGSEGNEKSDLKNLDIFCFVHEYVWYRMSFVRQSAFQQC